MTGNLRKGCVSVIVPVYNQKYHIEKCLTSICRQRYKNLQIIIVDDGSTDGTSAILDQYAKTDERIEVYHVKNQGVSETRNYGLSKVQGEYVQFVDADDRVTAGMTKKLTAAIERRQCDMAVCSYVKDFGRLCILNRPLERAGIYDTTRYIKGTLKDPGHHYYGVVWNKLYRTRIIAGNDLHFDSSVTLGEDFIFNLEYWQNSRKIVVFNQYLYRYRITGSTTLSHVRHKKLADCISEMQNRKKIFRVYRDVLADMPDSAQCKKESYMYWVVFYVRQMNSLRMEYDGWSAADKKAWFDILQNDKDIQEARKIVPQGRIRRYRAVYRIQYQIKMRIKGILGISVN